MFSVLSRIHAPIAGDPVNYHNDCRTAYYRDWSPQLTVLLPYTQLKTRKTSCTDMVLSFSKYRIL